MRIQSSALAAIACAGWLLVGCNARETAAPAAREVPSPPATAEPAPLAVAEVRATAALATPIAIPKAPTSAAPLRQALPTAARPAGKPSPSPRPQTSRVPPEPARAAATPIPPAPPASAPAAPTRVASAPDVVDPGGEIVVAATRPGLTRIGAEKCKTCHKVQFASWLQTAHARRTPPLDCEGCHGPGSEYKPLAVMKDPAKAKAAGLVMPTATFCARCHVRGWKPDMLREAHAHKAS